MSLATSRNGHVSASTPTTPTSELGTPSPNGANGRGSAASSPSPNGADGRDQRGRFTRGNRGGPGNPFARRVARLRTLILEIVSEDELRQVVRKLVAQAQAGDLAAARLLLGYLIGRPADTVDPDRLDVDEWRLYQECPTIGEFLASQPHKLDPGLACVLARLAQNQNTDRVFHAASNRQAAESK